MHMPDEAGADRARSRLRSRLAVPALVFALVCAGVGWWVIDGSDSSRADELVVSHAKAADQPSGVGRTAHSAAVPTPAQVGRPAPSQISPERPARITLASGTSMRVRPTSTAATGSLDIPSNIKQAGWWDGGSKLGDPFGAIVVAAHVDSFTQGLGRFAELLSMKPGDVIRLDSAHLSETFQVASAGLVPKSSISATSGEFSASGQSRLVLITCGGQYDPAHGGYQSNMVVVAIEKQPANARVGR
jgi:Sortase domain